VISLDPAEGRSPPLSSGNSAPEKAQTQEDEQRDWKPGQDRGTASPGGLRNILSSYPEPKSWVNP